MGVGRWRREAAVEQRRLGGAGGEWRCERSVTAATRPGLSLPCRNFCITIEAARIPACSKAVKDRGLLVGAASVDVHLFFLFRHHALGRGRSDTLA